MSYAENALPATLPQASQPMDFLKELGLTPQQNANLMEFLRTGDTGKTANSLLISRYLQAFNEGRTGKPLAEAAGQSGAQVQGADLDAAGVRQDADMNAALSGQRAGELAGVGQAILGGVAAASAGYLIYRDIRMLPSLLPAFWWTIPANLVAP